jgi:putative MATE family efflux protein
VNIVFFLAAFLFPSFILSIYTNEAEIISQGQYYLKVLSLTFLIQSFTQSIVTVLRSAGVNRLGFYTSTIACLVNMAGNWVLIFGNLGAPALGLRGAACATVFARIVEFLIVGYYLFHNEKLPFAFEDLGIKGTASMVSDMKKQGTPSVISEVTQNLNVSAAAMITGRVSAYYIAANTIVHNIWMISSLFLFGFSMGASVMIGHEIGAGAFDKAEEYARRLIRIALVIAAAAAVLVQVLAPWITSMFAVSEETLVIAAKLKNAASIAVFFLALQNIVCKGILRGGGQAAAVTKVDLLTCWLVNIPVGFVTALVLHADPFFIYLSLRIDYLLKTIWGLWRIGKGNWILRMHVDG